MNDLPPLPRGYKLLPTRKTYDKQDAMLLQSDGEWVTWDRAVLGIDWIHTRFDYPGGPFFAIPKPRYTCPLEFSRYVPDALESLL